MRRVVPLAVACLSLAVAGCGGSDTGSATTSAAPTSTTATGAGQCQHRRGRGRRHRFPGDIVRRTARDRRLRIRRRRQEIRVVELPDLLRRAQRSVAGRPGRPAGRRRAGGHGGRAERAGLQAAPGHPRGRRLPRGEPGLHEHGYHRHGRSVRRRTAQWRGPNRAGGGPAAVEAAVSPSGEDLYFLAFFGEPSETGQFMVQFGGHHLAYNLTYQGGNVSPFPSLTATEPSQFEWEGRAFDPLADEKSSTFAALGAADPGAAGERRARRRLPGPGPRPGPTDRSPTRRASSSASSPRRGRKRSPPRCARGSATSTRRLPRR